MIRSSGAMKRFNHLITETEAAYHEMILKLGLSDSAMSILYTVCNAGEPCPLRTVCRLTGKSKQTLHSALHKLEAEGVLLLSAENGRGKNIRLTEKGRALADATAGRMIEAENEVLDAWPQEDVERYLALTEKFLTAFREKTSKP